MFSENRGTQVLTTAPVSSALLSPVFWVASHNNVTNDLILKVSLQPQAFTPLLNLQLVVYAGRKRRK